MCGKYPPWLWYSLAAIGVFGVWGIQCKYVALNMPALTNQALMLPGLALVSLVLAMSAGGAGAGGSRAAGIVLAVATGALAAAGNLAFLEALGAGAAASAVVPMTSVYPAVTVILAVLLLGERLTRRQGAGLLLAFAAVLILGS